MADNLTSKVILDVQISTQEPVKNIAELRASIEELRNKQMELKKAGQENSEEYVILGEKIKALSSAVQQNSKTLQDNIKETTNAEGSYNALSAQLSKLKKAYKEAASEQERREILKTLVEVDGKLKDLDEKQGVYVRNVGNYKGAIIGAFSALPGPIGKATQAAQGMGGALKIMSTTPVIAILQLLLPLILKLVDAFKGNAAAMEAVNKAFAAFSGVGVIIDKMIGKIAEGITWLAGKLGKFAEKIGLVTAEMKESNRITQEELRIEELRRKAIVENAKAENQIAKLKADAADKENMTIDKRIEAYKKAGQLEEQIAQREYDIAQAEFELIKAKNAQSDSSIEDLKKEAEAEAKMIQTRTALFNKQKEINSQLSAMQQEKQAQAAKATAATDKQSKEDEKAAKEKQKRDKAALDLELAKYETSIGILGKYTDESYTRHIQYYDDLAALYEQDSAEYLAALAAKEKYQQDFNKNVEARAQKHDSILEQYGLIDPGQSALDKQLKSLQDALDEGVLAEEEYAQAVAEIYSRIALDKANAVVDAAGQIMNITNTIMSAVQQNEDAQMEEYREHNQERINAEKERLEKGLISQEQYDAKVAKLNDEQTKKEKELQLKQAKRQKAMAVMNATLNAAGAIIASLAQSPVAIGPIPNPAGIASLALATATGVAQIAAAAATPLPKASRGMLLRGPSHAQGGIPIEAEGGEAIINKRATSRYLPLLSAINESTGGVPLYANGGVIQQTIRKTENRIDYSALAEAMAQVHLTPQVAVTDINRGQERMAQVEQLRQF